MTFCKMVEIVDNMFFMLYIIWLRLSLNVKTIFIQCIYFAFLCTGELDPERMGSGIQYGDTSTRRIQREQQQIRKPDCSC